LQGKKGFIQDVVDKTESTLEPFVQGVELTLLQKINSNKSIYASELAELKTILNKPKLAKKDKEIAFELIKASLADIDKDFGKVKNQTEIDQIINQLKIELESK
jgi:DNA repair exonuclease SbcCD nuclease subunit